MKFIAVLGSLALCFAPAFGVLVNGTAAATGTINAHVSCM